MDDEPTITFRVDEANHGHVTLSVFIGRNPGARGHSGRLVLRTDELVELLPDPSTVEVLARIGVRENRLTLQGSISPHNPEALALIGEAWRNHHDREGQP